MGLLYFKQHNVVYRHISLAYYSHIRIFDICFDKSIQSDKKAREKAKAADSIKTKKPFKLIIDEKEKLVLTRLAISAGYIIISIYIVLFVYALNENSDYSETTGTVVEVYPAGEKDGKPIYTPAAHYTVNGMSYKADLPYTGNYKYGDSVKVAYDTEDPSRTGTLVKYPPFILLVLGLIPLILNRKELKEYWVWFILEHPGRCMLTIGTLLYTFFIWNGYRNAHGLDAFGYVGHIGVLIYVLAPLNAALWLDALLWEESTDKNKPPEEELPFDLVRRLNAEYEETADKDEPLEEDDVQEQ